MKNLEEIAKSLEIEIKEKKKNLQIIKTDKIMDKLKESDIRISKVRNIKTDYFYWQARPKTPFRNAKCSRLMSKSLGNVEKVKPEQLEQKKKEAISFFKNRWAEMRNDFEILKNNS
jgi:hypothetical protein